MQEAVDWKKKGDIAFRRKDFSEAIDCYTQFLDLGMISATVFVRRSLCYLMSKMGKEALDDAMKAQRHFTSVVRCIVSPVCCSCCPWNGEGIPYRTY
ncbi:hypothetical protein EUTSA_v10010042mg [Eutrema salsugineum]|uniref:Serine/threonine-protein kinase BSK n=1 Tax=Eutrema salsugineum TaxID=72664 RepID=V4KG96_EUTSA|nr:hypothetical protein EUTSA_v10010042mg [Eutrema salsugineum]